MSIHSNNFYSNILRRSVTVQVILPEPLDPAGNVAADFSSGHQLLPVIWLLHGFPGRSGPLALAFPSSCG